MEGIGEISRGKKTTGGEYNAMKRDGTRFPFLVFTTCIIHEGRCTGIRGILIDMTERKKHEHAMQQAMKKLNLLNSISRHDIINKLVALSAYLDLVDSERSGPEASAYIDQCKAIVTSVSEHVEFMRDYQEIGIHSPVWQDPSASIRRATVLLAGAGIRIIPPESGYEIFSDPLFSRVIDNLFDNAIRHGGHVTEISFALEETPDGLLLTCKDNGEGISRADKECLFQKGFGKHTGLGLFLSREILGITGITIQETGEPGKGARFEILVPRGNYRRAFPGP